MTTLSRAESRATQASRSTKTEGARDAYMSILVFVLIAATAKKRTAPAMPMDLLAELCALPDPTPDAPWTTQYSNNFMAFRAMFSSVIRRYLPNAAQYLDEVSREASRRWRLIKGTPVADEWAWYAACSQEVYGPNPDSRGNKRQRARERKILQSDARSRNARPGASNSRGSPYTVPRTSFENVPTFRVTPFASPSSLAGSFESSPSSDVASLSPQVYDALQLSYGPPSAAHDPLPALSPTWSSIFPPSFDDDVFHADAASFNLQPYAVSSLPAALDNSILGLFTQPVEDVGPQKFSEGSTWTYFSQPVPPASIVGLEVSASDVDYQAARVFSTMY